MSEKIANKNNNLKILFFLLKIVQNIFLSGGTRNMNVKKVMKENVCNNLERQDEI